MEYQVEFNKILNQVHSEVEKDIQLNPVRFPKLCIGYLAPKKESGHSNVWGILCIRIQKLHEN